MGSLYEINDTLLLAHHQGFPFELLDFQAHTNKPISFDKIEGKVFQFHRKQSARAFQLDPVRVYLVERTVNNKWLFWGKALIQSITIAHNPQDKKSRLKFTPDDWITSGSFKIIEIYNPSYQKLITQNESPKGMSFFG